MLKNIFIFLFIVSLGFASSARINVVTSYKYIGDIAQRIGANKVYVYAIAPGNWDPHFVVPKPSYIMKLRRADLLIINGGQLEIGWMPPLINQANNGRIQPGKDGFLDISQLFKLIQKPQTTSRAMGDIHPDGNPHFNTDPYKVPLMAQAISARLCKIDPKNTKIYRENEKIFLTKFRAKLKEWDKKLSSLKGTKVIEYHRLFDYLLNRYHIQIIDTIEPLPGITPTSSHISEVINTVKNNNVKMIITSVYAARKPSEYISKKTSIPVVVLPNDIGATSDAKDIFSLFDSIVSRLTK